MISSLKKFILYSVKYDKEGHIDKITPSTMLIDWSKLIKSNNLVMHSEPEIKKTIDLKSITNDYYLTYRNQTAEVGHPDNSNEQRHVLIPGPQ